MDPVAVVLGELSFVPPAWQARPDKVQVLVSWVYRTVEAMFVHK